MPGAATDSGRAIAPHHAITIAADTLREGDTLYSIDGSYGLPTPAKVEEVRLSDDPGDPWGELVADVDGMTVAAVWPIGVDVAALVVREEGRGDA